MSVEDPAAEGGQREGGFTLVELLVTVVIMGLAFTALLGGLGTAIIVSDQHRQQAVAGAAVRSYAEAVVAQGYIHCAAPEELDDPPGYTTPEGYTSEVTAVQSWSAGARAFADGCEDPDAGAQRVTVRVSGDGGRGSATLDVVVRNESE